MTFLEIYIYSIIISNNAAAALCEQNRLKNGPTGYKSSASEPIGRNEGRGEIL